MLSTNEIRKIFLDYFKEQGHEIVKSSPLLPHNDPTLLFTNAGMVQFKNVFTGDEKREYKRAASSQKCLRAGGKHNDLENVGYTARHHTFFEMLGNFSFGDYFKEGAIKHAWTLLTEGFKLPPEKLLVTVYHTDDEAYDIWKNAIGLPEDKIIRIATNDNFWSMGDTGPCGPCSEIFYDHGEEIPGGPPGSADEDGDRFIEIWNLVFMQFNQKEDGSREELPSPSIDTGMGLERIAAILQGKHSNFEIDLFQNIIKDIEKESGAKYEGENKNSHHVIADHLRAMSFMIADGITPSNEGRGYVLRRIMRRAMRHAHILGCKESLMHKLVPSLIREMGEAFPELTRAKALITQTLKDEEDKFKQTLANGLKLLEEEKQKISTNDKDGRPMLSGEVAFKLYDTYGFPIDLTQDILRKDGIVVDMAGFNTEMEKQKAKARKSWAGSGEKSDDKIWHKFHEQYKATEFTGYNETESTGTLLEIVPIDNSDNNGENNGNGQSKKEAFLLFDQTPFYAESGGQIGDTGLIKSKDGDKDIAKVLDTQKFAGSMFAHHVEVISPSDLKKGELYKLVVDQKRRKAIKANHSATHLLHAALRSVLGDSVVQKGSYVGPDRLRFDFAYNRAIDKDNLKKVEKIVNEKIRENSAVITKIMDPEEAIKAGAMALFGEKYGEKVRVLSMGEDNFSVELCGGTHVERTGDIGVFKIISESSVGSGVRRIEALTGIGAESYFDNTVENISQCAAILKTTPEKLTERIEKLIEERKRLEKELKKAKTTGGDAGEILEVNGNKVALNILKDISPKELKPMADSLKQKIKSGVVMLVATNSDDDKVSIVVGVTNDLTNSLSAVDIVRKTSEMLGGKGGGGRPDLAQAGGSNPSAVSGIREKLPEIIG